MTVGPAVSRASVQPAGSARFAPSLPAIVISPAVGLFLALMLVLAIALGAFFPVLMNTVAGVRQVDGIYLRAARNLGADGSTMFVRVSGIDYSAEDALARLDAVTRAVLGGEGERALSSTEKDPIGAWT